MKTFAEMKEMSNEELETYIELLSDQKDIARTIRWYKKAELESLELEKEKFA